MPEKGNSNLGNAKKAKNDEFYTQFQDIEKEMNAYLEYNKNVFLSKTVLLPCDDPEWSNFTKYFAQNFQKLGLKKLISTSYSGNSSQPKGRIYVLTSASFTDSHVNIDDLEWSYLDGDGDFRSDEVKALRDEADFIVTNPPFSLFREFLAWILEGGSKKKFSIIGNMNAITYKEVFPLIKDNKMWLGASINSGDREFQIPTNQDIRSPSLRYDDEANAFVRVDGVRWFTNIEHGRRHEPLGLMTEADNIKFSKHANVKSMGYQKYDNYDAIEVPFTDSIPSDYKGVMGVPISFLSKYNPDQFEILGMAASSYDEKIMGIPFLGEKDGRPLVNGKNTYARIFIQHKKKNKGEV